MVYHHSRDIHRVLLLGVSDMPAARNALLLAGIVIVVGGPVAWAGGPGDATTKPTKLVSTDPTAADQETLKNVHLDASGAALLEFLHKRMPGEVRRDHVAGQVAQLADKEPKVRNKAAGELVMLGTAAIAPLRKAAKELDDTEAAARAQKCLDAIHNHEVTAAVIRLLAAHKPEGTVQTLLAYLPFVEDEQVNDELVRALAEVGLPGGLPHPDLMRALEDPVPVRRATVAEVLCRNGNAAQRPAIRKLLRDPKAHVRMRTALVLAEAHDSEAIPVLIELLGELDASQCKPVEEFLSQLAAEWALTIPSGNDGVSRRLRRDLWLAWWKSMEGPTVLDEFRKRTVPDADREKAQKLIAKLNDDNPAVRDQAEAELLILAHAALPSLRKAMRTTDGKSVDRIRRCLTLLERDAPGPLPTAAARLVGLRKPVGAAEALLAYLPCAEDEMMSGEIQETLARVSLPEGVVDPALLRALEDKLPLRRIVAAEVLCQVCGPEERAPVRKLLSDPDMQVRTRVAFALAGAKEKDAIPALIALLDQVPPEQWTEVDDYLRRLAGDNAPKLAADDDPATRRKTREEWTAWWKTNGDKVELARSEPKQRLLGYTLLVEAWSPMGNGGRVLEIDAQGKKRWEISGLQYPVDAQVVGNDRVLIAEYSSSQVTERDFKGNVIWQKQVEFPVGCQRLHNGNTLIVTQMQIQEVDRKGREVFTYNCQLNGQICVARKLRNGQFNVVTSGGRYYRLDAKGKELKSYSVTLMYSLGAGIEFPGRDHVLMPMMQANKVTEYNAAGKLIWEAAIAQPSSSYRLPNGNTLVASQMGRRAVELNRSGKIVWEYKDNVSPHYATRR
jgi:HEAT repeat protein